MRVDGDLRVGLTFKYFVSMSPSIFATWKHQKSLLSRPIAIRLWVSLQHIKTSHLSCLTCKDFKPRQASRSTCRIPDTPLISLVNESCGDSILFILHTVWGDHRPKWPNISDNACVKTTGSTNIRSIKEIRTWALWTIVETWLLKFITPRSRVLSDQRSTWAPNL